MRALHPERAEQFYSIEADLLTRSDQLALAIQVLDKALAQTPDSSGLRYARRCWPSRRATWSGWSATCGPSSPGSRQQHRHQRAGLHPLANRTERYEEAYALISQALALQPDEPAILDSMGWVLYRMNRLDEALDYLPGPTPTFPIPEVAAHLGEVLWVSGDTDNAVSVWRGGLLKDPGNAVLAEHWNGCRSPPSNWTPQGSDLAADPLELDPRCRANCPGQRPAGPASGACAGRNPGPRPRPAGKTTAPACAA